MAPTLTGTVDTTTRTVALTVTGAVGAITVKRYVPGLPVANVRGTFANSRAVTDYDVPLNIDVVYIATDAGPPVTQSAQLAMRVNSATAMLQTMSSPVKLAAANILADFDQSYAGQSVPHKILGTNVPLVTIEPPAYRSGTYRIHVPTNADWLTLRAIVMDGGVILLRSACQDEYADTSFIITTARVDIAWSSLPPRVRVVELDYQAVAPDTNPPYDVAWDWAAVPTSFATWADVPLAFPTWADVVTYIPPSP